LHGKNTIKDGLGGGFGLLFCFVCLFTLDSLIFLVLDLIFHHKIYRDHTSYKTLESQKRPALMHAEHTETGQGEGDLGLFLIYWYTLFPYVLLL